jgi:phage repressor protein C with HTH and peptisase S24 domain
MESHAAAVTSWNVVEAALGRRRPPRDQTWLANSLGVKPQAVNNWKRSGEVPPGRYLQIAQQFGLTADQVAGKEPLPRDAELQHEYAGRMQRVRRIVIVGTARLADGVEGFYDEISSVPGAGDGYIDIATADPNAYGLRVRGNSMAPAIRDGWYVLVEPNSAPAVGEYVLIKLRNGQRMVKELLFRRGDAIEVLSVNDGHRRTIYRDELDSIQAVAAVVSPSKWKPD